MKPVITISNLKKNFRNKEILQNINLSIYESQSLAIIGESGSGKSVLTKCISGLLDFDFGKVIYKDLYNLKDSSEKERNMHISKFGILFQNAALFDSLNIYENITFGDKKINICKTLESVGLHKDCLATYPANISVGMQKRVGLARAILTNPEILILDEPTTGLDPIMSIQINKLLKKMVTKNRLTTITITHDMSSVYEYADKVAFISDGTINWYGDIQDLKKTNNMKLKNFIDGKIED
tara:strand:- start:46 stop:762 length:717 start_codon:yes stop_codon:yes gene_type:complete